MASLKSHFGVDCSSVFGAGVVMVMVMVMTSAMAMAKAKTEPALTQKLV